MELKVENGWCILKLDKSILVLSRDQFLDGLRRGKWWKRRQASAPRHAMMQRHAMDRRDELD